VAAFDERPGHPFERIFHVGGVAVTKIEGRQSFSSVRRVEAER
jgi:hypothetical protein